MRAIAASRRADAVTAWRAIAEAETAARLLGDDRNDFDTEFGPTNVSLHAVAVAVELGEAAVALRRAADVHLEGLSPERRARFLIDVARAQGQRRHAAEVVSALTEAAAITPEQVRHHPLARELVRDLLRRTRHGSPELVRVGRLVGID